MSQTQESYDKRNLENSIEEISSYIDTMLKNRIELPANTTLPSTSIITGKFLKLLTSFIGPLIESQRNFNDAVLPSIGKIRELLNIHGNKNTEQDKMLLIQQEQLNEKEKMLTDLTGRYTELTQTVVSLMQKNQHLESELNEVLAVQKKLVESINSVDSKIARFDDMNVYTSEENFFIKKTYSQSGEDSILAYIIKLLGLSYEKIDYIDLGANHAREMSNTYFFYSAGSKGILVEANPHLIPELKFYRHRDLILNYCISNESENEVDFYILNGDGLSTPDYTAALAFCEKNPALKIVETIKVKTITFNDIVEKYLGKAPTILSIDIEGYDEEVLRSINFDMYRPTIIVTEMISYDTSLAYSTKKEEIKRYLDSKEYDEYAFTGINSIFIDRMYLKNQK